MCVLVLGQGGAEVPDPSAPPHVLLVLCLSLRLAHTGLHQEGLHELEQLANGDDGTCHRLCGVVNDVDGILNRLLVEQLGEGNVSILVGKVEGGHCPVVNTELLGLQPHRNLLVHALASHLGTDELVQLLGVSLDGHHSARG